MTSQKNGADDLWYDYETEPPAAPPTLKQRIRKVGLLAVLAVGCGALFAFLFEMGR